MNAKKYFIIIVLILLVVGLSGFYYFSLRKSQNDKNAESSALPSLTLQDISAPSGWHSHRINETNIIFTTQTALPVASNTETSAYGEQINVSIVSLDGSPEDSASKYIGDNVLAPSKIWSVVNGHRVVMAEVNGEAKKSLDYEIFGSSTAYIFSLYPENTTDTLVLESMVNSFIAGF